jgi:AcrR family transcriptional regulator
LRVSLPQQQILEIQRSRLLAGALAAVAEQGYAAVMVGHITRHAKVSRRTYYEIFENREACLTALQLDILTAIEGELAHAGLEELPWRERVRRGLWTILSFFDREPALARMLVVEALRGGAETQAAREEVFARLALVIDEGRAGQAKAAQDCTLLTAEGLVGAAFGIVHARLARTRQEPLAGLLGELMGMIILPYLGLAAARAERALPAPSTAPSAARHARSGFVGCDPLQLLPMRVTYRTAKVLQCIGRRPGASNRDVSEEAGVKDQGQISKLLARLERLGLAENSGEGAHAKGEPNAWRLTPLGQQVTQRLQLDHVYQSEAV